MIISFFVKDRQEFVSIDGAKPMVQENHGCHSMHQFAELYGGISFSDEPIEGWAKGRLYGDHLMAQIVGFGDIGGGAIALRAMEAIGFKYTSGKIYWKAENKAHLMTADQWKKWIDLPSQKRRDEYAEGLFPPAPVTPPPQKKGRARKGEATITLTV